MSAVEDKEIRLNRLKAKKKKSRDYNSDVRMHAVGSNKEKYKKHYDLEDIEFDDEELY
jgi:hypothetical protein